MSKCSLCGYEDSTQSSFCVKCGAKMDAVQQGTYQQNSNQQQNQQPQGTYQQNNYQQPNQQPQGTYQQNNNQQQQGTYQQNNYQQQNSQQQYNNQNGYQKNNSFTSQEDHTAEFNQNDIQQNRAMAILAYIGILVLIPIFAAKDSPYAKFHANQGLVLIIISVAAGILASIFTGLSIAFSPLWIVRATLSLVSLGCFVLMIIGIVNAANNQAKDLPIIGRIKLLK